MHRDTVADLGHQCLRLIEHPRAVGIDRQRVWPCYKGREGQPVAFGIGNTARQRASECRWAAVFKEVVQDLRRTINQIVPSAIACELQSVFNTFIRLNQW